MLPDDTRIEKARSRVFRRHKARAVGLFSTSMLAVFIDVRILQNPANRAQNRSSTRSGANRFSDCGQICFHYLRNGNASAFGVLFGPRYHTPVHSQCELGHIRILSRCSQTYGPRSSLWLDRASFQRDVLHDHGCGLNNHWHRDNSGRGITLYCGLRSCSHGWDVPQTARRLLPSAT